MNDNSLEFKRLIEHWVEARGFTKKRLYKTVSKARGVTMYWLDGRERGLVKVVESDLDWLRTWIEEDLAVANIRKVDQYQCYDCEDAQMGKPYYTMIPADGDDPGAFLCPKCFEGLEAKGFKPDNTE